MVEEGGSGDVVAVPIAYDILEWWFTQFELSPPILPQLDINREANYDESSTDVSGTVDRSA